MIVDPIRRHLAQLLSEELQPGITAAQSLALALLTKAVGGDVDAIRLVYELVRDVPLPAPLLKELN